MINRQSSTHHPPVELRWRSGRAPFYFHCTNQSGL